MQRNEQNWDPHQQKQYYLSIFELYASQFHRWKDTASANQEMQKIVKKLVFNINLEISKLKSHCSFTRDNAKRSDKLIKACEEFAECISEFENQSREDLAAAFKKYDSLIPKWQKMVESSPEAKKLQPTLKKLQEQITKVIYMLNHPPVSIKSCRYLLDQCNRFNCRSFFFYYLKVLNQWEKIAKDYADYSKNKEPHDLVLILREDVVNALKTVDDGTTLSDETLSDLKELAQTYREYKETFSECAKEAMGKLKAKRPVALGGPLTNKPIYLKPIYDTNRIRLFTQRPAAAANDGYFKEKAQIEAESPSITK